MLQPRRVLWCVRCDRSKNETVLGQRLTRPKISWIWKMNDYSCDMSSRFSDIKESAHVAAVPFRRFQQRWPAAPILVSWDGNVFYICSWWIYIMGRFLERKFVSTLRCHYHFDNRLSDCAKNSPLLAQKIVRRLVMILRF